MNQKIKILSILTNTSLITGTFLSSKITIICNQFTYNFRYLRFLYYTDEILTMCCDEFLVNENIFVLARLESFLGAPK